MTRSSLPTMGRRSSRPNADRDGLTVYDLPTAFYLSDGKLCARWPYCPHRGRASCEARPAMEPAPDTDQAEYVVGLYAERSRRLSRLPSMLPRGRPERPE